MVKMTPNVEPIATPSHCTYIIQSGPWDESFFVQSCSKNLSELSGNAQFRFSQVVYSAADKVPCLINRSVLEE